MATQVRLSKKFSIAIPDVLRGGLMAALTSALVIVQQSIDKGDLVFNWKSIAMAAVGGGVAYLLKNFLLEPPKVITTVKNNEKGAEVKADINKVV